MAAAGIDSNALPGLNEVFDHIPKPFDGLETRFKQEKYYLFLVVSVMHLPHYPLPCETKGYQGIFFLQEELDLG
ncbi:MAG: hypothetical protein MJE68_29890 [Proteobacteria bacterium]|nr:hypothetical protein [Pseudomonadota bacterium]